MALTKRNEVTQTIDPMGRISVLTVAVIEENGAEIARTNHRQVLEPGDSTSGKPAEVAAVAALMWTRDKLDAAQARRVEAARKR